MLLREVVRDTPAVKALRERVQALPEAAGYYDRIRLGELVSAEVGRRRERDQQAAFDALAPHAEAAKANQPRTANGAFDLAFLVSRDQGRRLRRAGPRARRVARGARTAALRRPPAAVQLRRRADRAGGAGVGLITGLLTLPLAPVRGTVWLAERIQEQAEREYYDESAIRAGLQEIEEARATGEVDERELDEMEDALIERLLEIRGLARRDG